MIIYICEVCGKEFIQKTPEHKTCSKECRKIWKNRETLRLKPEKLKKMLVENRKKASSELRATNAIKASVQKDMMQRCGHIYCEHEGS